MGPRLPQALDAGVLRVGFRNTAGRTRASTAGRPRAANGIRPGGRRVIPGRAAAGGVLDPLEDNPATHAGDGQWHCATRCDQREAEQQLAAAPLPLLGALSAPVVRVGLPTSHVGAKKRCRRHRVPDRHSDHDG
jgi:hypothetical protein